MNVIGMILISLLLWGMFSLVLMIIMDYIKRFTYLGMSVLWFDFWIGVYYDREKRFIYINPFPCFVFKWRYGEL